MLGDVLGEGAHLLDADAGVGGEFDPDGADLGLRGRVRLCGEGGVFGEHGVGGAEGRVHFFAAGRGLVGVGGDLGGEGADRLRRTAGIGVVSAEVVEGYLNFFFADFVALIGDVSGVLVEERRGGLYPVLAHLMYGSPCPP